MLLERKISNIRDSVCGLLRVQQLQPNQLSLGIVGTAWCIVQNRFLVTAHHVLNNGNSRNPSDRFMILRAPNNGPRLEQMPVIGFRLEDAQNDFAILEISDRTPVGITLPALRISFDTFPDGTEVVTYGCPAPEVKNASIAQGQLSFQTSLVTTANLGIISAQLPTGEAPTYVFSVHWFNGESGGPVLEARTLRVFAIMQRYRNIAAPHGTVPGPRIGRSLSVVRNQIQALLPNRRRWWNFSPGNQRQSNRIEAGRMELPAAGTG